MVYRAWQVALDRRVALKLLKVPRSQDESARAEFREKFAGEAKTIAKLRHAHIVDVYDFSVANLESGELVPWMALEWLEGETLAKHLERRRRAGARGRSPSDAVDFLRPVLEALAHAHAHGIAHRDIKPSNIMVTETPRGSSLRVLDFGIAKIMADDQPPNTGNTRTESTPAFSPAYAAPEQVAFSRTGPWTDVHALGLTLTEVMTDEAPFLDGDPEAHLFEQVMARVRPTPASKGRDVGLFEPVLAKALALSPRDRWRSAGELLAALETAKANESTVPTGTAVTVPATVGNGVNARRRPRILRRPMLALASAFAVGTLLAALGAARRFFPQHGQRPNAHPASAPDVALALSAEPVERVPAPAPASTVAALSPPAADNGAPVRLPSRARPGKKVPRPAPALSVNLSDGRDLFNDTR